MAFWEPTFLGTSPGLQTTTAAVKKAQQRLHLLRALIKKKKEKQSWTLHQECTSMLLPSALPGKTSLAPAASAEPKTF